LAGEPGWPECDDDTQVVFLVDASSPLERSVLEGWVQRHCGREDDFRLAKIIAIPPSRRRGRADVDPGLEAVLAGGDDALLAPLRVAWLPVKRDGVRSVRLRDLLALSDPRDPGHWRQRFLLRRHPDRCRIVAGEPALTSALRRRWTEVSEQQGGSTAGLAEFVVRQAALALERGERRLRGARYKVPRLIDQEILGSAEFRGRLTDIAREMGESDSTALRKATADLREIAATHSPFVIDIASHLIRRLYTQGYGERLEYDRDELARIAALSQRHPVVFLPSHKSNLDHLVLQYMLHENGLPPNHTAAGINMNFFPVGPLIRRSGTFFIRRSFRDDPVYKLVLRSYIDYLIGKRFSLEWYIEGGRSRSGKLLPPRFGLLAYVLDAYRRQKCEDVYLIPVSIAYDQIQEVGSYSDEQQGAAKEKEGFGWFIRTVRSLRRRYGKIHIRFGEPFSLQGQLGPSAEAGEEGPDENELALQKIAFEVSVRINRATPITPTSLVTLALLGTGERALTVAETRRGLSNLLRYVDKRNLPATAQCLQLDDDDGVRLSLDALVENGVVTRFDGGPEAVYLIGPGQQLAAAYYRNTVIHFFVNTAIMELAVLHAGDQEADDPVDAFWAETMRLRDLFKFEFFFAEKEIYHRELLDELSFHDSEWQPRLAEGKEGAGKLIRSIRPFTAHRVLRPFLESYRVVSDNLQRLSPAEPFDEGRFISNCLGLGKQYRLQHLVHSASSISKVLFQTALKLAENRGLLDVDAPDIRERRDVFAHEIRDAHRRVEVVVALATSRRAGLIP
jgi:glycerol-3-phosphate O-acyltransferase